MKKVLIVYFSATGKTETMAEYVAEGVRFSGAEAIVKNLGDIKDTADLTGYDGYIFGSPTFSLDMPTPVKNFLTLIREANLEGKMGGSFGSYRHDISYQHDSYAPAKILNVLQDEYKMKPFELGPFNLKEDLVETREGIKACQDYGRFFGSKL